MADDRDFVIVVGTEFQRVADALRVIDERLPGEFRRELREAAKPLVRAAQAKVRALELPGGPAGSTGLRQRVARGVYVQASTGYDARVRIVTSMASPDEQIIPRGMDRAIGWRHPVFGHRNVWVTQPGGSWFLETMADGRQEFENRLQGCLDRARDTVAAAGI